MKNRDGLIPCRFLDYKTILVLYAITGEIIYKTHRENYAISEFQDLLYDILNYYHPHKLDDLEKDYVSVISKINKNYTRTSIIENFPVLTNGFERDGDIFYVKPEFLRILFELCIRIEEVSSTYSTNNYASYLDNFYDECRKIKKVINLSLKEDIFYGWTIQFDEGVEF